MKKVASSAPRLQEDAPSLLYHRAMALISKHDLDTDLNRITLAKALKCSPRSPSRAFGGKSDTLRSIILLLKLHKET